jgi:trk system potassium uptake protein TrkH
MKLRYKNSAIENAVIAVTVMAVMTVASTFVMLYGFERPVLSATLLHTIQMAIFFVFLGEKAVRLFNVDDKHQFIRNNWFEGPLLLTLFVVTVGAGRWFAIEHRSEAILTAISAYLVLQVISKVCLGMVMLAASGLNPTRTLIGIFVILILGGAGLLMLPKAQVDHSKPLSFTDALFTATSATCVTGLIVRDTGGDFTRMGQIVILTLIQLGGLGIVIFGGVLALLLGQALSVKESVAMQDLLSTQTMSRIGAIIGFIFGSTILMEAIGAVLLFPMWDNVPGTVSNSDEQWFFSIFHSVSAFCNAGFGLCKDSLMHFHGAWGVYGVICPLIVIGGLGFGVLYNLTTVFIDRVRRILRRHSCPDEFFQLGIPVPLQLQSKIVLSTSALLIVAGTVMLMLFEHFSSKSAADARFLTALFQSITSRTAGFNTVCIADLSEASKLTLIFLMFIGGSSGSPAGGIKTVTFALIVMVVYATLRKRREVEMFKRSVRLVVVGRAITVVMLFGTILLTSTLGLCITERWSGWSLVDLAFEASSALGTVGLSTGVTPTLTTAGKWIIIMTMLVGRLGPLTLLAGLMFNFKPAGYDYPSEPLMVG